MTEKSQQAGGDRHNEQNILSSWEQNVSAWTSAVREQQIETRVEVTNQAIIDEVTSLSPETLLDIGCGEGWLVRALTEQSIDCWGMDASAGLIAAAKAAGDGQFIQLDYSDLTSQVLTTRFAAAVANFSLIGKQSVEQVFQSAPALLSPNGHLIVQTLHPKTACGDAPYRDGWRTGSWDGFSDEFRNAPPWYFRTLASWVGLYVANGFQIEKIVEPLHPSTQQPCSLIIVGSVSNQ